MKRLLLLFLLLVLPAPLWATTYWASSTGGAGTCGAASGTSDPGTYRTFPQGVACLVVGDTLVVKNGTYKGLSRHNYAPPTGSSWNAGGFTTVRAETRGGVTFNQAGDPFNFNTGSAYVVLDGFVFDGTGEPNNTNVAPGNQNAAGVGVNQLSHHIRYQYIEVKNWTGIAWSTVSSTGGDELLHSSIHDNGFTTNENCVYVTAPQLGIPGGANTLIEDNDIYACGGAGVQLYAGDPSGSIVRYNRIRNVTASTLNWDGVNPDDRIQAVILATGNNVKVYGNIIYNLTKPETVHGVRYALVVGSAISGARVYNNTIYNVLDNSDGSTGAIEVENGTTGAILENNIVVGALRNDINLHSSGATADYNYCNAGCTGAHSQNIAGTPFVAPGTNFALVAGSKAIGAGLDVSASIGCTPNVTCRDNIGTIVPQNTTWDMGALESPSGVTVTVSIGSLIPTCPGNICTAATHSVNGTSNQSGGNVTWSCDRCTVGGVTSGTAVGTNPSWLISNLVLKSGLNTLTVTGTDGAGNVSAPVSLTLTYAPTFPGNSLVAAYGFETGSGTSAVDSSGNGNTGTLTNGPAWVTTGRYGNALLFDGTNDYVTISGSANNTLDLTQGFTISAWVQPTAVHNDFRAVVHKNALPLASPYELYASIQGGCGSGNVEGQSNQNGSLGPYSSACSPSPLPIGTWTHLALTYDRVNLCLYRNANNATKVCTPATGYLEPSNLTLQIGATEFGEFFQGLIDEVRIYNYGIPLTGGGNTVFNAPCNVAGNLLPAGTPSVTGDANCPVIALGAPLQFRIGAGTTFKIGAGTEFKIGASQ